MKQKLETQLRQQVIVIVIFIFISRCRPTTTIDTPTVTVSPDQTSIPRWMIYEKALSMAIVKTEDGLCEWETWGRSSNEVYLWALCKVRGPIGTAGSVPAVIQLGANGAIVKVTIPRDGANYPEDIRRLFPLSIQNRIFAHNFASAEGRKIYRSAIIKWRSTIDR